MSYLLSVGQRVRAFRKRIGMSQDTLAKKCGYVSRSSINKIELGYTDMPLSKILTLAEVLSVSPIEIMLPVDPDAYTDNEAQLLEFYKNSPDVKAFIDGIFAVAKGGEYSAAYIEDLKVRRASEELLDAIAACPESDETLMPDEDEI